MSFVSIFRSAFFFLCLLFSLSGYYIYQLNVSIENKDTALINQQKLTSLGDQLAKGSDYLTTEIRSYVQFGNQIHYDNFWKEVNKTRSRNNSVERIKKHKVLPKELFFIERAKWYSDNLIKTEQEAMDHMKTGNINAARALIFSKHYMGQKKLIMENIQNFQNLIKKRFLENTIKINSTNEYLTNITVLLLIFSGLLVLFFFYFIGIKQLVEPLKTLTSLMKEMAGGNLNVDIPISFQKRKDEIYEMASTIIFFKKNLIKVRNVEKGINQERQRFFNMLDQLPVCFHLQASDYTIPFANRMFRDRFGSIENMKCHQVLHQRKIACDPCPTFIAFDSQKTESSVWNSQDGKTYMSVVTPFHDSYGESLLMEMSMDITNEQQSRKSQLQSEARFRTIFEESPLGVALIDSLNGHIYEVNVKFAEIAGRSLAEMASIDWMSITHPDDLQEDLDNMVALNSGKISGFTMEKRYVKPDASYVWINMTISPLKVENKNKPRHLCMIEDITEKKKTEKDLTRFGRVLNSSSNEIYMFSSTTLKFTKVNLGASKNLGYSMNELSQLTSLDLKTDLCLAAFEQLIKPLREQKETKVVFETVHKRKDESLYPVNVTIQLFHEESPPLFVEIIEDITSRKKAESALKEHQNTLESEINRRTLELKNSQDQLIHSEKLSTLGAFAGTIAHEFNNPLFGVINLVDKLGEEPNEQNRKKYSDIAQKECWRMAEMIKNLQSFYRPSEGVFVSSEIDEMIEGVLLIVAKACEIKRIQIKKIFNTDIFSFEVIDDQITQVLLNILQNSIDSISEDGGKITLTLDRTNSDIILKVQDTGEGIKKENLKLIFDPLFTTKGKKGTGLGLSISYGIIKSHHGDIEVESALGVGTTFILTLPVSRTIC
jgi:PAS domain S-box-containing protein